MDVHINGGTFSLGHRKSGSDKARLRGHKSCDIGNHHFPSPLKAALAKELTKASPEGMTHAIYGSCGGEVIDLALKTARNSTGRRKIVSIQNCYHGHTGLAVTAGADRFTAPFLQATGRKTMSRSRLTIFAQWNRPCPGTTLLA
jgi:acetylornithine/succinyldiaminopimelate/putrescine aminotransferase